MTSGQSAAATTPPPRSAQQHAAYTQLRDTPALWDRLYGNAQYAVQRNMEHAQAHRMSYHRIEVFFDWPQDSTPEQRAAVFVAAGYPEGQAQQMSKFYGNKSRYPCLVCPDIESMAALLSIPGAPKVKGVGMLHPRRDRDARSVDEVRDAEE